LIDFHFKTIYPQKRTEDYVSKHSNRFDNKFKTATNA